MDKKILIIDDEPNIRSLMVQGLSLEGFEVFSAADGNTGLEILKKNKPSLIFLDLNLPQISGLEILKQIKLISPETVVIMLSGGQDEDVAKEAIELGAYDYVTKPISLRKLIDEFVDRIFGDK